MRPFCQLVSLSRTATRRPDKSSRLVTFSNRCRPRPPLWGGTRTLQEQCSRPKRIPSAIGSFGGETQRVCPLSRVPLLALFPSRPSTPWPHALWIYVARPSSRPPSDLDPQWRLLRVLLLAPSSVAPFHTLLCESRSSGAPVARNASLFVSVGWPFGPTS